MGFIDGFLNKITMYRLVLYYLTGLIILALVFSALGFIHYGFWPLLFSAAFLTAICWAANTLFAKTFKAHANVESVYISAFILVLILTPPKSVSDYIFLFWAGILAMASKYVLAINKKHVFNPVAVAVTLTALLLGQSASWWVGTPIMLLPVVVGGFLVVRKTRRSDLVFSFLAVSLATTFVFSILNKSDVLVVFKEAVLYSCIAFFAFVMLTEPLTTPPTKKLQMYYGAMVGLLFAPQFHIGGFYFSPEYALVAGNIFSYLVSPKDRLILTLREKIQTAAGTADFVFSPNKKFSFSPGQYLEWTLAHKPSDSRGNRRYFTIASSPREPEIRLGVKFYQNPSSFKKALLAMEPGQTISASQLAGDFTLPKNPKTPCVFIAGGIGITPFRSMVKYLLDKTEKRPIVVFYSNKTEDEIAYKDIFDRAQKELEIKTIYTLTDTAKTPAGWTGQAGYIDDKMISRNVPDFKNNLFYVSGPSKMVSFFERTLIQMGVPKKQIMTDFFPGFA